VGEAEFLAGVHGTAGRLLAVAEGGVKKVDAGPLRLIFRLYGGLCLGHGV
jgi:hypothetical protein